MATYTNNLNLKKPSTNEYYDVVADNNDSKDKIDLAFKEVIDARQGLSNVSTNLTNIKADLGLKADKTYVDIGLSNIAVTQINKNLGKFDQTYMTNEFIQQIAGTTPVNAIPADKSISPIKTSFMKAGKNLFNKGTAKIGFYVNQDTGLYAANAAHTASDYMEVEPNTRYIGTPTIQRYAWFTVDKVFIAGGLASQYESILSTGNAKYLVVSNENINMNIATMQVEKGITQTVYTPYEETIKPENSLITGDENKKYKIIGANIRTPLTVGGVFALHNDVGHEPMGIHEVAIYEGDLRVVMNFTASKVITMTVVPHISLMQEGYQVACSGGLNVHAVAFFKNGVKIPAQDVVINGGSLWISGMFLL